MRLLSAFMLVSLALSPVQAATHAGLPSGCDTFSWDVSRELAALSSTPRPLEAGDGREGVAVHIELDTFYRVALPPQAQVTMAARPGKPMLDDGAHAGLLHFRAPAEGRYRVSITSGHWIDVVDAGQVVPSLDFQGRRGCPLVHKIVEYPLPAGRDLVLQLAGATDDRVGVVITRVDAGS